MQIPVVKKQEKLVPLQTVTVKQKAKPNVYLL